MRGESLVVTAARAARAEPVPKPSEASQGGDAVVPTMPKQHAPAPASSRCPSDAPLLPLVLSCRCTHECCRLYVFPGA